MNVLLSAITVFISILAIFINQWVTLVPRLGIGFQYRRRRAQFIIAIVANGIALALFIREPTPGSLIILALVMLLTALSGFNHARRVLVSVDEPHHVPASAVNWPADDLVLGYADDRGPAVAWSLATLVPHHLVNDTVAGQPILVAW